MSNEYAVYYMPLRYSILIAMKKYIAFIFYSYNESVEIVNREKNKWLRSNWSLIDCIVKDLATEFHMQIKPKDGEFYA